MSDAVPSPKEAVYDREINPLMTKVIEICKANDINVLISFSIGVEPDEESASFGNPILCTTALLDLACEEGERPNIQRMQSACNMLVRGYTTMVVTTRKV